MVLLKAFLNTYTVNEKKDLYIFSIPINRCKIMFRVESFHEILSLEFKEDSERCREPP